MKNKLFVAVMIAIVGLASSCSSSNNNNNSLGNAPANTIVATFNGQTTTYTAYPIVGLYQGQTFQAGGSTGGSQIDLIIGSCAYPNFTSGTYSICLLNCPSSGTQTMTLTTNTGGTWVNGDNGSVSVNFSNRVATGTFTTILKNGSGGTLAVSGSFNISY